MIGCKKTKLKTSGIKKSWVKLMFFDFSAEFEMAFWPKMGFFLARNGFLRHLIF